MSLFLPPLNQRFGFGRSTRTSRNSSGPLVRRRRRWARSSGGAAGSTILSIAFAASSAARNLRSGGLLTGLAEAFTVRPSSTRRRMASDLDTLCFLAHSLRASIVGISKRAGMVPPYLMPGGRPIDFLYTDFSCLAMTFRIHEKQAEGKLLLPPRL